MSAVHIPGDTGIHASAVFLLVGYIYSISPRSKHVSLLSVNIRGIAAVLLQVIHLLYLL